ncbi:MULTISPECIES: C40 family peptidase [unclassified Streptomyces]|uniref:C40 family peptidase n=1 Tax=unclassified Streptomyces TaxID=2593676 RepID=UPI000B6E0C79|nr:MULTISPECIES: C40 family peptidase [unclassified Streptomyces]SNB89932.1 hypothetical protein SAMN02745831_06226 [Streptomyces sp. PgraA7]
MTTPLMTVHSRSTHRPLPRPLTVQGVAGPPELLEISDEAGLLATLTVGARTVAMRGPVRTFTENKRPFHDTFDRTRAAGWGPSGGGGSWSNANGVDADYTVTDGAGIISMTAANSSRHATVINNISDVDARLSWSLTVMPTGNASSLALSFAYTNVNSMYRARLSVLTSGTVQLILERESGGSTTTIGALTTVGTGYTAGDIWHIRVQRKGTTLRCRAWKDGTSEPATWVHEVTDATLGAGRIGVRGLASSGSTAVPFQFRVHDIQLYSGTWPDPPVITHDTWIRLLDEPYDGQWTPALAAQVRAWAYDTTPDALAYAMMYVTGAPPVTDPSLAGAQIAGQSRYGPLDSAGAPVEGADFHDYIGVDWEFVNGETRPADAPELHCMDCSGYVRMVYGYHMGIPMVRLENFDGINLPRITKDIGPSGPGVIVAQADDTAPPLGGLQIGDVPLFDADSDDAVSGQLDHNGIYMGVDQNGHLRFANSRKTPNGPTLADVGGASRLDGSGTYATTLRLIRRF